ncbi:MAG: GNAT family N-acetyltransferase [Deltaproteobacteria bacterium]|nr:GNAT family N-acetyltransferase [Deltaproteobacteria bacterium]
MKLTIHPATSDDDIAAVRELFVEYENFLGFDLCFQGFEQELASLPGDYGSPRGCLLLARGPRDEVAGCVAVRPFDDAVCEMKRLYLRAPFRGHGQGRRLAVAIVEAAREIGFSAMRLDTVGRLTESIALYRSIGFVDIPPYRENPHEDVVYLELALTQGRP